ncbi:pentatricopeptide repeat-containing protein At3g09040, mitochondrial [Cryptomeria japonica]|uniref:pentatricopeptide repeat-containing protein At3g09040, mitochondrial n=1 Tax=Cryptomeria japonica TaxID=3369 RepID=UPI0027DA579F|nr:pentatricopeptide repeat-containing protein At3g09040, mitochondrial [Cryptomeria japonica]
MLAIAHLNIKALCREGCLKEALHILLTTQNASPADINIYVQLLNTCIAKNALSEGRKIHSHINERGHKFATNPSLQSKLIHMYDRCRSLVDARNVMDKMTQSDVLPWNRIIAAYRRHGFAKEALQLFHQMQVTGVQPDQFTFAGILPACAKMGALEQGIRIHQRIIQSGFLCDDVLVTCLIDMYAKCGRIHDARELYDKLSNANVVSWTAMITGYMQNGIVDEALKLFQEIPQHNVVSWTAIIAGYAQSGLVEKALDIFKQMQLAGVKPTPATYASILPACAKLGSLEQGMRIHKTIIESGFLSDAVVGNALVSMYARCGSIQKARELFDKIPQRSVVSWNAMIVGYAQNGLLEKSLEIFKQMRLTGVNLDSSTFATIIPVCAKMGDLEQGIDIHQNIIELGLLSDEVVVASLVDMYAKCGAIQKARELFDKMVQRNVVSWTALIAGYAQNGPVEKSLGIFKEMQFTDVKPDSTTFSSVLPACAKLRALHLGMGIHEKIIESGFMSDAIVVNALIDMYAKCGSIRKAQELFENNSHRSVVSWNVMIVGYSQNEFFDKALEFFKQMQLAGVKPNSSTYASILPTCAKFESLKPGIEIHQKIIKNGFLSYIVVATALIDMYTKCGSLQKAQELFDKMPHRNVVSWTVIIAGYTQNGLVEQALDFFRQMQSACIKPNSATFASILPACAKLGALEQGTEIHQKIIETGSLSDVVVNALIDMYAKCGSIQKARDLFDKIHYPGIISWNAMIAGYAMHGYSIDALKLFELMKHSGTNLNHISFLSVLFACSHAGLVDDGCKYFNSLTDSYCITPTMDHYACMVDLFGRAGYLEEALYLIIKMSTKPDIVVWKCLLGACRSHKDTLLGEFVASLLFEMDQTNAAPYVLLSNIYAEVGRWDDAQRIRKLMEDRSIVKLPGCSWIEVHKL